MYVGVCGGRVVLGPKYMSHICVSSINTRVHLITGVHAALPPEWEY